METKLDYHLVNYAPSLKTKLILFQKLTGPGIFNSRSHFPIKGAGKHGFDSQSYNDFGPFVRLSFSRFWTEQTTNASVCRSLCLFQLTTLHQNYQLELIDLQSYDAMLCCFHRKNIVELWQVWLAAISGNVKVNILVHASMFGTTFGSSTK